MDETAFDKHAAIADRDVVLADVTILDSDRELAVSFLFAPGDPTAKRILAGWAETSGYSRVWFEDGLVELDPETAPLPALPECPICGARHNRLNRCFWGRVRAAEVYPLICLECGSFVPQWIEASNHPGRAISAT